ncbi:MAG: hypothetical protein AABZ77_04810 [Chloroflexota bacterium]
MKKQGLFSRWFILPVVLVAMVAALMLGFTQASFNDIETSNTNTATAWTSSNWTQTTQAQFSAGVLSSVNTTASPGDVILLLNSVNATNSPTTNTGSAWTSPNNTYANGGGAATITSGNPSSSNVWGNYGYSFSGNVSSVRVRYDAWSTNNTLVTTANKSPTANANITANWTFTGGTSFWGVIADSANTSFMTGVTNTGGEATFNFTAFTVPAGSTNITLNVVFLFRSATTGNANRGYATVRVGNNYTDAPARTPNTSSGAILVQKETWTTNPNTGANWSVDQINGVGTNALIAFGVGSTDFNPDVNFYEVKAWVTYDAADDEQIKIDVSWDGGTSWSSVQTTDLTATETTYWYDVTAVTTWTPAKLANGQLQVRATTQTIGDPGTVSLDWIPVEVTYIQYASSGTIASQVLDTTVTGSRWDGLMWDETLLSGTYITIEVRASDTSFLKTDGTPSWTSIGATSPVILGLPSGRYKQWRATLSTTNVTQTPLLNEARTYYYGG